jgi:uncharacterized membrane protein
MNDKKRRFWWAVTVAVAVFLVVVTFTPLVMEEGKTEPELLSMPFTLWVSILITILLVVLTWIGGFLKK